MVKKNTSNYNVELQRFIKTTNQISLKYYGINDLSTGYDIKLIVDNDKLLEKIFQKKLVAIKNIEDLYLYFFARKLINFEETIPYITGEDNKDTVQKLINICRTCIKDIQQKDIIKYINHDYKMIFIKDHYKNDFLDVILDFIFDYNTGINENVWMYLAEHFNYILINNYDRIKRIFLKKYGKNLLDKIINIKDFDSCIKYDLQGVLNVLEDTSQFENDEIAKIANEKIDTILKIITIDEKKNEEKYGDRYLIIKSHILHQVVDFLIRIKDGRANQFIKKVQQVDKKENEVLKNNGEGFVYEIPIGEILKSWREEKNWLFKLLSISHDLKFKNKRLVDINSRIEDADIEKSLLDHISYNIPTDDYFTYTRQLTLQINLSIGAGLVNVILNNDQDSLEYCELISSALSFIKDHSDSVRAQTIIIDNELLIGGIRNLAKDNYPETIDYYGLSMLICALLEKILKILIEDIVKADYYISTDQLTLGKLLRPSKSNELVGIFGENHLKHLSFYLTNYGDKRIGYGKRNKIAHLSDNIEESIDERLVSELLWLFTDVLNTILWKYLKDNLESGKTEKNK